MDDAPFALKPDLLVLHQAGIRHLLAAQTSGGRGELIRREPWATFLSKTPAAPVSVWTYLELGLDLSGKANPARGALWRELIRILNLPRGYVAFWPYSLPEGAGHALHPEAFLEGLALIAPRTLVVFDDLTDNPASAALASTASQVLKDIRVCNVSSPEEFLRHDADQLQDAAEALRLFLQADA